MNDAVVKLNALAQETRLSVFRLVVGAGLDGMAAGRIATRLDVPAPTLSFHLMHLTQAGLLVRKRRGRSILYAVDFEGVQGLFHYLVSDCCQGRPELCGLETPHPAVCKAKAKNKRATCQTRAKS